ncbi:MAG: DUF3108 domain-containing protein [Gallionellaceae bacterium]|jgi:hypothetical protein
MKHTLSKYLFTLILCLTVQPVFAEPASKIQARFDVIGFGFTLANINETFTRTGDSYKIESVTTAVGLLARLKPETIRVISEGKITAQGLVPHSFVLTRETDTDKNARAKFNWETATLTHYDYKGVEDLPLAKGTQDRLSVVYHLPLLAQAGQHEINFNIADGNNVEKYFFTYSAEEQLVDVPLGEFKTRFLYSTPVGESIKYEIWMAVERNNFPCKIIVTDSKGGKLTQVLTELTITP